jgi:guanylate kinase
MNEHLLAAIDAYEPFPDTVEYVSRHPALCIAGPTGAGKGTLATYLTQSGDYAPVVSDTTRQPRKHNDGYEVNGVNYWFIDEDKALAKVQGGDYIEVKAVHETTMYGTSTEAYKKVVESDRTPILEIDVQGIEDLMARFAELDAILLLPPNFDVWQQRLDGRGDMGVDEKVRRFRTALKEIIKPIENPRFFPVINTEVIDTAQVIASQEYRQPEYRERALKVAHELLERTVAFLRENDTV